MTFWEHLDELRNGILRSLAVVTIFALLAFGFKDELFAIVLAPKDPDIRLINTELTSQFMVHMTISFYAGIVAATPYIIYELYKFIAPALYQHERRYATRIVLSGYIMFMAGAMFSYFVVFPFTFRFLGNYQVSADIDNLISLSSYIDTFVILSLMMGTVFELPVVSWFLGKLGLLNRQLMQRYRRHAIVAILIVAAFITPTTDAFTLFIVALPVYLLYELSTFVVPKDSLTPTNK
mgnify:CR=1 FL=1